MGLTRRIPIPRHGHIQGQLTCDSGSQGDVFNICYTLSLLLSNS
jgi:hypothetical protein